ncbi:hypothetical protein OGCDGJMD_02778 [Cyanobium usitatum str. Tous]|jgi:hypothetical protein|nr:hypothetical protein OGCDGJMD_02778 [Cyanobium usitatum str. Tous]
MRTCLHLLLAASLVPLLLPLPAQAAEVCTPSEGPLQELKCEDSGRNRCGRADGPNKHLKLPRRTWLGNKFVGGLRVD